MILFLHIKDSDVNSFIKKIFKKVFVFPIIVISRR